MARTVALTEPSTNEKSMRLILIIIIAMALVSSSCEKKSTMDSLPVLRTVTAFRGTDQNNSEFSASKLKGKIWIASFFFSRCGSVCPALNTVLARLQADFSDKVSFVSLTSDPEYDTPEVMKEYAQQYGAKPGVWWFVTMPIDSMIAVASRDLGLVEPSSPEVHSTRFVLIDQNMNVRGFYDSADTNDVSKLQSILETLP